VSKRTCPVCDKEFEGKNNQRFCPPTEDDRKRSGPNTQPRSWCAKRYERHVSRGTPLKGQPPQPFTCRQCGKHCVQGKDGIGPNMTTYCSKRCKKAWHRKRNAPGPHCRVSSAPKPRTWRSGRCPECGEWFVCTGISKTKFCSRDCLKKTCKRRRRAMVKGVGYKTLRYSVIAERDKWTCQLCGVSYEPPGTWWAWVVMTPCAKIPASTRERIDAGVLKPANRRACSPVRGG